MTNEEAIKHGKDQLEIFGGEHREFIELAIKALEQQQNIHDTCKKCVEFSEFEQQHCEDCISREEVIQIIENKLNPCTDMFKCLEMSEIKEDVEHLPSVQPQQGWIPIKTRPMTDEEKEHYYEILERSFEEVYTILDCTLPDDGQEVIVSSNGYVGTDIFCRDSIDGCYFEIYDIDDVEAWMPLPQPYKVESEDEE